MSPNYFFEKLTKPLRSKSKKLFQRSDSTKNYSEETDILEKLENKNEDLDQKTEKIFNEMEGKLTVDVYQTPNEIVIKSTIAGVHPKDLDINITNDMVTIKGRREKEEEIKKEDYFIQECYWGAFSRSIILPQEVEPEKAEAKLHNGILTIRLPKIQRLKTKKIKVEEE